MNSKTAIDFASLKPVKKKVDNTPIDFTSLKPIDKTSDSSKKES